MRLHKDETAVLEPYVRKLVDAFAPLGFIYEPGTNDPDYLRITPEDGVIEIGHIWFGDGLQRTTAATEQSAAPGSPSTLILDPLLLTNGVVGQVQLFDAHLIGLTATPNKQTFGFFNQNLVMEYGHAQAVAELLAWLYALEQGHPQATQALQALHDAPKP